MCTTHVVYIQQNQKKIGITVFVNFTFWNFLVFVKVTFFASTLPKYSNLPFCKNFLASFMLECCTAFSWQDMNLFLPTYAI